MAQSERPWKGAKTAKTVDQLAVKCSLFSLTISFRGNQLFQVSNKTTVKLQTELDFRSLLLIPTLPWRQNLFHSCTLKETSCSFFFFKSNTNATCANCPTSFLSFHYLFLMALKLKTTELNGWEFSLGDRLPELTPWPGNNRQVPSPPSFLITVKL